MHESGPGSGSSSSSSSTIRIDRVRLVEIDLPLRVPFRISGGTMRSRRSVVVELHAGGAVGYGESAPFEQPFYSSETTGSVLALQRDLLVGRVLGRSFRSIEEFDAALRVGVRGNPFARCGFENAFWDLERSLRGVSLRDRIVEELARLDVTEPSRAPADRVASGVALGIPEPEDAGIAPEEAATLAPAKLEERRLAILADWIREHLAHGYRRLKIKIRPGWDVAPCRLAREIVGPDFPFWPDANASYDLAAPGHLEALRALDEFAPLFLEQPLHHDDILDHARLGGLVRAPVCLDESLKDARVARQVVGLRALGDAVGAPPPVWNIKVQRMGGLLEALRVYAVAAREGIALWGGTMPESGIGAAPILALAAFPAFVHAADVEPSDRWYAPGTDPLELTMDRAGWIEVPGAEGVAGRLDLARYAAVGVERLDRRSR